MVSPWELSNFSECVLGPASSALIVVGPLMVVVARSAPWGKYCQQGGEKEMLFTTDRDNGGEKETELWMACMEEQTKALCGNIIINIIIMLVQHIHPHATCALFAFMQFLIRWEVRMEGRITGPFEISCTRVLLPIPALVWMRVRLICRNYFVYHQMSLHGGRGWGWVGSSALGLGQHGTARFLYQCIVYLHPCCCQFTLFHYGGNCCAVLLYRESTTT